MSPKVQGLERNPFVPAFVACGSCGRLVPVPELEPCDRCPRRICRRCRKDNGGFCPQRWDDCR